MPAGRKNGIPNFKKYRWHIIMLFPDQKPVDKKFSSLREMKADLGLNWTSDFSNRLWTWKKVDRQGRLKEDAFINKYSHIRLRKIDEPRL